MRSPARWDFSPKRADTPIALRDCQDRGTLEQLLIDSGKGTTRAEDAQGTPAQRHISPSILVYEGNFIETRKSQVSKGPASKPKFLFLRLIDFCITNL